MESGEQTSLKGLFQKMIPDSVGVIRGKVVSASPLKIQVVNDDKLLLSENLLCVPRHLSNYTAACSISKGEKGSVYGPASDGSRLTDFTLSGSITIHNALKVGDTVYLLSFNEGKKYYVLDREV